MSLSPPNAPTPLDRNVRVIVVLVTVWELVDACVQEIEVGGVEYTVTPSNTTVKSFWQPALT